ncbi:MAG: hypothetical protein ACI9QL_002222, partial [Candidatus Omnitrophota bacterium]
GVFQPGNKGTGETCGQPLVRIKSLRISYFIRHRISRSAGEIVGHDAVRHSALWIAVVPAAIHVKK